VCQNDEGVGDEGKKSTDEWFFLDFAAKPLGQLLVHRPAVTNGHQANIRAFSSTA
jgi:hypothetical protein